MPKIEKIKQVAGQIEYLMLNKLQPGSVEPLSDKTYRVKFEQANPREFSKNSISHHISFDPDQETGITRIPHFPFVETDITNEKFSPSLKYRAIFRKKEDKKILEIWSATNLMQSLKVSDYHEDLYEHSSITHSSILWSADESVLLYVAEKKADKKVTAFDEIKESETDKYLNNRKFKQDLGENLNKKFQLEAFVYKLAENELYKVTNLPEKVFPAYLRFTDAQGSGIVFTGYQKDDFFMGLAACFNKPSSLYYLKEMLMDKVKEAPKSDKEKPTPEEEKAEKEKKEQLIKEKQAVKLTDDFLALMPVVSPDFKQVIYLSSPLRYIHAFVTAFKRFSLEKYEEKTNVTEIVEEPNTEFNGINGYHDVYKNNGWLSDSKHYVFASHFRGSTSIFVVNTENGKLKKINVNAHAGEDWNLLKIHNDRVIASVSTVSGQNRLAIYSGINLAAENLEGVLSGKWHFYDPTEGPKTPLKFPGMISIEERGKFVEEIITKDGVEGFFWSIQDFKDKKGNVIQDCDKPLILNLHGGPHGCTSAGYGHLLYYWLCKGYNILCPNFSGSTGFGQKFMDALTTKNGKIDRDEIMGLLNLALERKLGNPEKICVTGGSYGGFLSFVLLNDYPEKFRVAIIRNPAINLLHLMYQSDIPDWVFAETLGTDYNTNPTEADLIKIWEASPSYVINKDIKAKILVQLGGNDRRVPPEGMIDYFRRLKKSGVDIECHLYPNENHGLASNIESEFDGTLKRILYLEQYMPGFD